MSLNACFLELEIATVTLDCLNVVLVFATVSSYNNKSIKVTLYSDVDLKWPSDLRLKCQTFPGPNLGD